MSSEETKKRIRKLRESLPKPEKCSECGRRIPRLDSPDTKPEMWNGKSICKKCLSQKVDRGIQKNPVKVPATKHEAVCCGNCGSCSHD